MLSAFDLTGDKDRVIAAMRIIADKTGINGMLVGQSVDVENDGKPLEHKMHDYIYQKQDLRIDRGFHDDRVLCWQGHLRKNLRLWSRLQKTSGWLFRSRMISLM